MQIYVFDIGRPQIRIAPCEPVKSERVVYNAIDIFSQTHASNVLGGERSQQAALECSNDS